MLGSIFQDVHSKRLDSLANYSVGVMNASRAGIHAIGAAYAAIAKIQPKSGIKQVDRYLSNNGINVEEMTPRWGRFVIGARKEVKIALDWTDYSNDKQITLSAKLITSHGRATPLAWKTYPTTNLKGRMKGYECEFIDSLARAIPSDVAIELLADRGFGDQKLYEILDLLGWDYTIRFRQNTFVKHDEQTKKAGEWVSESGRATKLVGASVTAEQFPTGAVVVVHHKRMKEPWCLVTSRAKRTASATVKSYGRRFTIEETFRDQKDLNFGLGLSATHIGRPARRDRLLMLLAIAQALLTLLGAAAERVGLDRLLKANTSKKRTHSLFRQGTYWYWAIPLTREEWVESLMTAFEEVLLEHQNMAEILSII